MREEWGGALGRGLRSSTMSPFVLELCKLQMILAGVRGRTRDSYRFCQDDLFQSWGGPRKSRENAGMSNGQMTRGRTQARLHLLNQTMQDWAG